MEQEFAVVIVRTYETTIKVTATTAADARKQVEEYGLVQACSDYPFQVDTLAVERVKSVRKW